MSVLHDPPLERLLPKLHEESDAQTQAMREHYVGIDWTRLSVEDLEEMPILAELKE
jgi:hypothetical protein